MSAECRRGHDLQMALAPIWQCDECHNLYQGLAVHLRCEICNYDLCNAVRPPCSLWTSFVPALRILHASCIHACCASVNVMNVRV